MKKNIIIYIAVFAVPTLSFASLQPEIPEKVSESNSSAYTFNGFCNPGGGVVTISFGGLTFNSDCNDVTGTYSFTGDVSAEVETNPIQHCASQPPSSVVCSLPVDNGLAPPSGNFDTAPLNSINSQNESSYSVAGQCAPSGATLSLSIGGVTGVLSGTCPANNNYIITGDVSSVADGVALAVSLTVSAGASITLTTTVGKDSSAGPSFPIITGVRGLSTDSDSDSWLELGDIVSFDVEFSEPVNLSGSVELEVALTSGVKSLSYQSGSGSSVLKFSMPILTNDEQCNGLVTLRGIDLNGGSVVSVSSSEQASFSMLNSSVQVERIDADPPVFSHVFSIDPASTEVLRSPEFLSQYLRGEDGCVRTTFQAAIGETVGGTEVTPFFEIPTAITRLYQIEDGVDGFSFLLDRAGYYYVNLRATDAAGNTVTVSSAIWSPSPVITTPDLILYLDALAPGSIIDEAGRRSDEVGFDGFVEKFSDISSSPTVHSFTSLGATQKPFLDAGSNSLVFDQTDDCLGVANSPEINTATVEQRSFAAVVTMDLNVATRQMIFEEGASSRGMNLYVDGSVAYCGFWNIPDDGDGAQVFVSQSAPILAGQTYDIISVFNYTNYAGPAGPNGSFTCYLNGVAMAAPIPITSRLFADSGDVRLGCNGTSTTTHTGLDSTRRYSGVRLKEFVIFGAPPDGAKVTELHDFWTSKWGY